ncbi:hypothetical protein SDC9_135557 [bioreactor metagenome]|uniref:Uncharacterized protein n=1 Tax=bioreactor metagenome TaxID=1076179 RepID=A0A645DI08_9ZZZZ
MYLRQLCSGQGAVGHNHSNKSIRSLHFLPDYVAGLNVRVSFSVYSPLAQIFSERANHLFIINIIINVKFSPDIQTKGNPAYIVVSNCLVFKSHRYEEIICFFISNISFSCASGADHGKHYTYCAATG